MNGEEVVETRSQEAAVVGIEDNGGRPPSGIGGATSCCCYAGKDACADQGTNL
jgi:hypothetical protein